MSISLTRLSIKVVYTLFFLTFSLALAKGDGLAAEVFFALPVVLSLSDDLAL